MSEDRRETLKEVSIWFDNAILKWRVNYQGVLLDETFESKPLAEGKAKELQLLKG